MNYEEISEPKKQRIIDALEEMLMEVSWNNTNDNKPSKSKILCTFLLTAYLILIIVGTCTVGIEIFGLISKASSHDDILIIDIVRIIIILISEIALIIFLKKIFSEISFTRLKREILEVVIDEIKNNSVEIAYGKISNYEYDKPNQMIRVVLSDEHEKLSIVETDFCFIDYMQRDEETAVLRIKNDKIVAFIERRLIE